MARRLDASVATRLADDLGPARRARVHVDAQADGRFTVAVVAHDTRGLFAVVCGLLASHGLEPEDLRPEVATLEDAYLALTGSRSEGG